MTAEHVLERLTEGVAVITPGDRSDVVLAVVSAHAAEGFPSLSCLILNGGLPLHPSIAALVSGLRPAAADHRHRASARSRPRSAVAQARGRVTASSQRKIDTALALMDDHVDTADLLAQLAIADPVGRDAADVHLPAAGPGALGPQAHRAARGRRRPHPQGRRDGCCSAVSPT